MQILKRIIKAPGFWLMLLSIPAVWVLVIPGYFGASDDLHIGWLFEMDRSLRAGAFPPRFVPDLSYGFGYPLFQFVFPLPFYVAELFHLIGLSLVDSVKLLFGISLPLSGYLMYRWLRVWLNQGWSLVGGLLYLYTPYRSTDLYVRGAIGEVWSFVWLPLLGWTITRIGIGGVNGWRWVGIGALAVAGLILTHNITAYMTMPLFGMLGLGMVVWVAKAKKLALIQLASMAGLGLLASSYFWLPALLDAGLVKYDTVFNYADHFPTLLQLIKPYWGYGASVAGPYDGMSFFIGAVNWLVILVGVGLLIKRWRQYQASERVVMVWAVGCFGLAIVMMNFRSSWVWDHLPLIGYFQFPWRFLIVVTMICPVLLVPWQILKNKWWVIGMVGLILASSGWMFRPQDFLGRMDSYYLNRYIPYPMASSAYAETAEEYLRLPKEVISRPDKLYPLVVVPDGVMVNNLSDNGLKSSFQVESSQPTKLTYNRYYWPGWQAQIDGQRAELEVGTPFAQMELAVPAGQHHVEISFQETPGWMVLDGVSLLALLVCSWLVFKKNRK